MYLKKNNKIIWVFDPLILKKKINDICKIYNIHSNVVRFYSLEHIDVYIVQHLLKKKIKDGNILEIFSNKHTIKYPKHTETLEKYFNFNRIILKDNDNIESLNNINYIDFLVIDESDKSTKFYLDSLLSIDIFCIIINSEENENITDTNTQTQNTNSQILKNMGFNLIERLKNKEIWINLNSSRINLFNISIDIKAHNISDKLSKFNMLNQYDNNCKLNSFLYLQDFLLHKLNKNRPFFVGRYGGIEIKVPADFICKQKINDKALKILSNNAGIKINSKNDLKKYIQEVLDAYYNSNLLGIWCHDIYKQSPEFYNLIEKMKPKYNRMCAESIDLFNFFNEKYKFFQIFENKKVLIISSHKDTIDYQIKNKNYLKVFKYKIFSENTQLYTYRPVMQNAGNNDGQSFDIHLNKMKNDLKSLVDTFDFDIALVSCGGFGMLVCNYIFSKLNKSCIYVGGVLQLYFGIYGKRWLTSDSSVGNIKNHFNEYWTKVLDSDKPKDLQKVENGCYW